MSVNCAQVDKLKEAYLDGLLGMDARAEIAAHVDGCALCRSRIQTARQVAGGMRGAVRASFAGKALSPQRAALMQESVLRAGATRVQLAGNQGWRWSAVGVPLAALLLFAVAVILAWQLGVLEERPAAQPEPEVVSVPTLEPAPTRVPPTPISEPEPTLTLPTLLEVVSASPPPETTNLPVLPVRSNDDQGVVVEPTRPPRPTSTRAATATRVVVRFTPTRVGTRAATPVVVPTVTRDGRPPTITREPRPAWTPWPTRTRDVPPTRWPMNTPFPTRTRHIPLPQPTWTGAPPTQEPTQLVTLPTDTPVPTWEPSHTPVPTYTPEPEPTEEPTARPERTPTQPEVTHTATSTWPRPTRTMPATPTRWPHETRTPYPTRTRPPFPFDPGD